MGPWVFNSFRSSLFGLDAGYNIVLGACRNSDDWPTALVLLEELGDMAVGVHGVPGRFFVDCKKWLFRKRSEQIEMNDIY